MEPLATDPVDWATPEPEKIKILIVDDEAPLLLLLEEILANAGYNILTEKEPANAVNLAICMQPDVIILDVVMPGIDGFTICTQLKQNSQTANIPIIFLTINNQVENKILGLNTGGVDYLIKPLDGDELLARIQRHIKIDWQRRALERKIDNKENQLQEIKNKLEADHEHHAQHESPYKKILEALETGIIKIDRNFTCIMANESATHLLGYDNPMEMIGKKILSNNSTVENKSTNLKLENNNFIKMTANTQHRLLTKNQAHLAVKMDLIPMTDEVAVISFTDINQGKNTGSENHSPAHKDTLTGLLNKTIFYKIVEHENNQADNANNKCALFIIDLDYFKDVNDSFGHLAGDQVLCEIAGRLSHFVHEQDKVARLGGDEFGLLVDNFSTTADLEKKAALLIDAIRKPIKLSDASIRPSASIGIAILNTKLSKVEEIIYRADMALYKAKNNRQKGYYLFHEAMMDELENGIKLEKELSSLTESNQLFVEYQPQLSLTTGEYLGAEALVRWNHPTKGKLLPVSFLPIAEKRGFLRKISNHTLVKVCEQIEKWRTNKVNFKQISVNICAAQLSDVNFYNEVNALLDKHKVEPSDIVLELTENTLFSINKETRGRLLQFTERGIKFAIDDFGKGYSSMQLLKDMHSDIMKIDKNFVGEIESSEKSRIIIKAIIDLSKSLNMHVVAEGVENISQFNFLRKFGCDSFQGFFLKESIDPITLEEHFLKDQ